MRRDLNAASLVMRADLYAMIEKYTARSIQDALANTFIHICGFYVNSGTCSVKSFKFLEVTAGRIKILRWALETLEAEGPKCKEVTYDFGKGGKNLEHYDLEEGLTSKALQKLFAEISQSYYVDRASHKKEVEIIMELSLIFQNWRSNAYKFEKSLKKQITKKGGKK